MRYQVLTTLETKWKWQYLMRKHQNGEAICSEIEKSAILHKVEILSSLEEDPENLEKWIKTEMTKTQRDKLRQTIRAKRKRYFAQNDKNIQKKSIDLDYASWKMLAKKAQELDMTLSQTVLHLIDELDSASLYKRQITNLKSLLKIK